MGKKRILEEVEDKEEVVDEPKATEAEPSTKGKKALPPGYVCKACGMKDDHAIYNCTLAIKKSKVEKEAKKVATEESAAPVQESAKPTSAKEKQPAPSSSDAATSTSKPFTVFITGLPFKATRTKVIDIFQKEGFGEELTGKDVKLVMFEDRPEKCRGLAYVTFKNEAEYNRGLALSGKEMDGRTLQIVPCAPFTKAADGDKKNSNIKGAFKGRGKLPEGVVKIPRCYRCGALHDANQCTNKRVCYRCRSTEHLSSQCPNKKPKPSN